MSAGGRRMTIQEYRDQVVSEAEFQELVLAQAHMRGFATYHTYDSRRSDPGFPDLVLVRGSQLIFAELKSAKGRLSDDQQGWLDRLSSVRSVETHLWRPSDYPQIRALLERPVQR